MFLVIFFLCGSIWGFLESYLFWFLEDLGSTKLTMGVSLAIGTIAGIPLTIASGAIIRKLGLVQYSNVLKISTLVMIQEHQCDCLGPLSIFLQTPGILIHQSTT